MDPLLQKLQIVQISDNELKDRMDDHPRQRHQLLEVIDQASKSGRWQKRAKTGTAKPWYNDVSDW